MDGERLTLGADLFLTGESDLGKENPTPFIRLLEIMREDYSLQVSMSEWLDLQKVLSVIPVESVKELCSISRLLLVKSVDKYVLFDMAFVDFLEESGCFVDPEEIAKEEEKSKESEQKEMDEEKQIDKEDNYEAEKKDKEDIDEVAPGGSETSEEMHGGNEATGDIPDSPNHSKELNGKNKSSIPNKDSVKDSLASPGAFAKEIGFFEHIKTAEYKMLNTENYMSALRKIRLIMERQSSSSIIDLDVEETIDRFVDNAGLPDLVFRERLDNPPKLLLLIDDSPSVKSYKGLVTRLFVELAPQLGDVEVYFFVNTIGNTVRKKVGNLLIKVDTNQILNQPGNSNVIVVGDASMASDELWGGVSQRTYLRSQALHHIRDYRELAKRYAEIDREVGESSYDRWIKMVNRFPKITWLNVLDSKKWVEEEDEDGYKVESTIQDLGELIEMFELSPIGIADAVSYLMSKEE